MWPSRALGRIFVRQQRSFHRPFTARRAAPQHQVTDRDCHPNRVRRCHGLGLLFDRHGVACHWSAREAVADHRWAAEVVFGVHVDLWRYPTAEPLLTEPPELEGCLVRRTLTFCDLDGWESRTATVSP